MENSKWLDTGEVFTIMRIKGPLNKKECFQSQTDQFKAC